LKGYERLNSPTDNGPGSIGGSLPETVSGTAIAYLCRGNQVEFISAKWFIDPPDRRCRIFEIKIPSGWLKGKARRAAKALGNASEIARDDIGGIVRQSQQVND
jgi:hypothetical protein